jgi:hypothetical protein
MALPPSLYRRRIMELAKCSEWDAHAIEVVMRDEHPTLDALKPAAFARAVKKAQKTLADEAAQENAWEARVS